MSQQPPTPPTATGRAARPAPLDTFRERTALAWQRTALTLFAGALGVAKLTAGRLGPVSWVAGGIVLVLVAWVLWTGRNPERRNPEWTHHAALWGAALTGGVALIALLELTALLFG